MRWDATVGEVNVQRIGYLSGAPRVTTRQNGESGGARSHILGVINAYRRLGWEVIPYIYGDNLETNSGSIGVVKQILQGSTLGRIVGDAGRCVLGYRNGIEALRHVGNRVSYVYERFASFQGLGRRFKRAGVPWVLETQGLFYYEAKHERKSIALSGLAKSIELSAYRDCDIIVAVTDTLKSMLLAEAGVAPDKVIVVSNGVDTHKFDPRKYSRVTNNERPTLGFVGGLLRWQGLDRLLRAVKAVRDHGADFDVVIVGDGEERQNLQQLSISLGLNDRVNFPGRVDGDKVPDFISKFDICFSGHVPSPAGGMYHSPLKIYEYMSMAKPVIASDFFDARCVISGKGTGFLFDAESMDDLVSVLRRAYDARDAFHAMGLAASREIEQNHSWQSRVAVMCSEIDLRLSDFRELSRVV